MRRAPNEMCSSGFDFEAHEEDNRCSEACREGEEKEKKKVWKREKNKNQSKGLTKQIKILKKLFNRRGKPKDKKEIKEKFDKAEQGTEFKLRQVTNV